jgi:hypothetical protein
MPLHRYTYPHGDVMQTFFKTKQDLLLSSNTEPNWTFKKLPRAKFSCLLDYITRTLTAAYLRHVQLIHSQYANCELRTSLTTGSRSKTLKNRQPSAMALYTSQWQHHSTVCKLGIMVHQWTTRMHLSSRN